MPEVILYISPKENFSIIPKVKRVQTKFPDYNENNPKIKTVKASTISKIFFGSSNNFFNSSSFIGLYMLCQFVPEFNDRKGNNFKIGGVHFFTNFYCKATY